VSEMPALNNYRENESTDSMREFLKVEDLSNKDVNESELFRCVQDYQNKSLFGNFKFDLFLSGFFFKLIINKYKYFYFIRIR
jgi:hypothetical protein